MKINWIQYLRYTIQALFLIGLWWPILPSSEIIGQQLFLTIFFVGVFFCGWICPFGTLQEWIGHFARHLKYLIIKCRITFNVFCKFLDTSF